jgi:TonB family protein
MTTRRELHEEGALNSANNRLKGRFRSYFWSSMIVATVVHFAAFSFWPELTAEDFSYVVEELTAIELPPEIEVPPAPKAMARPATPVIASTDISEDITIAPTTFEMNPVDALPPPPTMSEETTRDLAEAPTFTPFTLAPQILNRDEVIDAMRANYPVLLKASGVGGVVRVFFFIDAEGHVQSTRVDQSSGYELLDAAALAVADTYRFSPAVNRDTPVPVWVSFPITFQVAN